MRRELLRLVKARMERDGITETDAVLSLAVECVDWAGNALSSAKVDDTVDLGRVERKLQAARVLVAWMRR